MKRGIPLAKREVFKVTDESVKIIEVDFVWYPGFAVVQKQKSIQSLHENYQRMFPEKRSKVLEVSTKSDELLGRQLSAMNLSYPLNANKSYPLELVFQSSKVFEKGGPFKDLLKFSNPIKVKKDPRLKESGKLVSFRLHNKDWPLFPETFFYNYIYIRALHLNPNLRKKILEYDAFTDIEFNSKKSINCQALACALFVWLERQNKVESVLKNPEILKDSLSEIIDKETLI